MSLELDDEQFVLRLRARDEAAFGRLVDMHAPGMLRIARRYVADAGTAEEVVQETWLAVLRSLDGFRARSSLKSWIFSILIKRAMTRGKRDARQIAFSALARVELDDGAPSVSPDRFEGPDGEWPRHWLFAPAPWPEQPESLAVERETIGVATTAISRLPEVQRTVVELRDIAGQSIAEIAATLDLAEGNVRVLLHRGRSKVRAALEAHFAGNA